jgi:hypothetical protein
VLASECFQFGGPRVIVAADWLKLRAKKKKERKKREGKKRIEERNYLEVEQVLAMLHRWMDPTGHGMTETGLWP